MEVYQVPTYYCGVCHIVLNYITQVVIGRGVTGIKYSHDQNDYGGRSCPQKAMTFEISINTLIENKY